MVYAFSLFCYYYSSVKELESKTLQTFSVLQRLNSSEQMPAQVVKTLVGLVYSGWEDTLSLKGSSKLPSDVTQGT